MSLPLSQSNEAELPWKTFTPARRPEARLPPLSLTIPNRKGRYAPFLLLAADLVARLQWKAGDALSLEMGDGSDFGTIRLSPAIHGDVRLVPPTLRGRRKRCRIFIGHMPCLGDEPIICDPHYRVVERTLLVTIPLHARARQLARNA